LTTGLSVCLTETAGGDAPGHALLPAPFEAEQGTRVAHLQLAVEHHRPEPLLQVEQPQQIAGCRARAPDRLRRLPGGSAELAIKR